MINHTLHHLLTALAQGQTTFDSILIKNANLQARLLPFISFRNACMPTADFRHAILPGANFEGATLGGSNFEHANLLAADFAWANLTQANLGHTLLSRSTLVGANLANANLAGASMLEVDLTSANLRNANLSGVSLKGANLSKANLFGARVDANALSEAILEFTIMPNGECLSQNQEQSPDLPNGEKLTSDASLTTPPGQSPAARHSQDHQPDTATDSQVNQSSLKIAATRTPSFRPKGSKHIWFQFTENSADLDLKVATSQET